MNTKNFKLFASVFALVFLIGFVSAYSVTLNPILNSTSTTPVFSYNVSDATNVTNCSLFLNNVYSLSNASAVVNGTNTISKSLAVGSYSWYIGCNDSVSLALTNSTPSTFSILSYAFTISQAQNINSTTNTGILTLNNTGNTNLQINLSSSGDFTVSSFSQNPVSLNAGEIKNVSFTVNNQSLKFGTNTITISAAAANATTQSQTFTLAGKNFCSNKPIGNNLSFSDVTVKNLDNSDELTWAPLDDVTVNVEVENHGTEDIKSVVLVMGLFLDGSDRTSKLIFVNADEKKIELGRIDSGDTKSYKYEFQVPADIKEGSYKLVFKAYNKNLGESLDCAETLGTSYEQTIDVQLKDTTSKYIAFDNVQLSPEPNTCGTQTALSFETFNIGIDDQDRVMVHVYNKALGIDASQEISDGLISGDSQTLNFLLNIPATATDGDYVLQISADYRYSNGAYREINSGIIKKKTLQIIGCPQKQTSLVTVSAIAASDIKVGQNVNVLVTINNAGNMTDFSVVPVNFDSWATASETPQLLNVAAAGTGKTTITVHPTKTGMQTFGIKVTYNGQTIIQPVSLTVLENTGLFSQIAGMGTVGITLLIAIALIILLIIIVMIVKLSSKPRHSEF